MFFCVVLLVCVCVCVCCNAFCFESWAQAEWMGKQCHGDLHFLEVTRFVLQLFVYDIVMTGFCNVSQC